MLWYKAWRESRARFVLAATALTVFCVAFVAKARMDFPLRESPMVPYAAVVWSTFYGSSGPVVFSVVALVLSLGGLQRERSGGTVAFTLALPVSRGQLLAVRAAVGLLEMAALTVIPALLVPTLSPLLVGQSYPATQALAFALLFISWGVVWFAVGFLWSILLAGEYTAGVAALLTPFAYMVLFAQITQGGRRFPATNPFYVMSGQHMPYFNWQAALLIGPLPWTAMLLLAAIAVALIGAAVRLTARQSF
jgi:ABC-2 type transport system permease protein